MCENTEYVCCHRIGDDVCFCCTSDPFNDEIYCWYSIFWSYANYVCFRNFLCSNRKPLYHDRNLETITNIKK